MNTTDLKTITTIVCNKVLTFTLYENDTKGATVRKTKDGQRVVIVGNVVRGSIKTVNIVPLGIASCAAGKDAWMRNINVTCGCCGALTTVRNLEGNDLCPECYEEAGKEIAQLDGRG